MKFLVWLLVLFAAAVVLGMAAHNPGYVLMVYPPYRMEMSLTLFVLGLVLLFVAAYLAVRLVVALLRLPSQVRTFREERAQSKSRAAMMEALTAFFEGRYATAEKAAVRAMEMGDTSALNHIIAARSAHELREFSKRDAYLSSAEGKTVGEDTMRLMAKTEFMLDQKQPQSALSSLREMSEASHHKHVGALQLELKAQQLARNWDAVLSVLTQLEKRSAIDATAATQLRQQAWLEKLTAQTQDLASLQGLWKSMPVEFKRRTKIAAVAARSFIRLKDCRNARQALADSLNAQWDSELVTLYGDCQGGNLVGQIEDAEKWLTQHPDDAGLLLALGKLCLHQSLWGKAQSYLDASNSLAPSRAAYTALAQLADKLGQHELAARHYQKAAQLTE